MKKIAMIAAAMALVATGCTTKQKSKVERAEAKAEAATEDTKEATKDEVARAEEDIDAFAKDVEDEADRTLREMEEATAEARDEIDTVGDTITAEVVEIDQAARKVTFRLKDTKEEIQLQAGKEIDMTFADLEKLGDEVIEGLKEGDDYEVIVEGVGDAMKIAKIELEQAEKRIREETIDKDKKY